MTSQRVERTWIRTGGYGRFRGEWVKMNDGSAKCNRQWALELQNSHVCEKSSNKRFQDKNAYLAFCL